MYLSNQRRMKISIIGVGYVGLVTGACFAEWGHEVICIDIDRNRIEFLKLGKIPIYEPGLEELVLRNAQQGRLNFSTNSEEAIKSTEVVINAVGTPLNKDNKADLSAVESVARVFGQNLNKRTVFVNKSTIPMGGATHLSTLILESCEKQETPLLDGAEFFEVVSNPEFLREGSAIQDFMNPDRIVIGVESEWARQVMEQLYEPLRAKGIPLMITSCANAEAIKYASNAFLATKISFINEMASLCEIYGANIEEVAQGMGMDPRIAPAFLKAGIGYGGSCLPKDVMQLIVSGQGKGAEMSLLRAVDHINRTQPMRMMARLKEVYPELRGLTFAIWGLTFKPETDDIRESAAMQIIPELIKEGAMIRVFDPQGMINAKKQLGETVHYAEDHTSALKGADALLILTEWEIFKKADLDQIKKNLKKPIVIDGRNLYDLNEMKSKGFVYKSIGRTL